MSVFSSDDGSTPSLLTPPSSTVTGSGGSGESDGDDGHDEDLFDFDDDDLGLCHIATPDVAGSEQEHNQQVDPTVCPRGCHCTFCLREYSDVVRPRRVQGMDCNTCSKMGPQLCPVSMQDAG